VSWLRLHRRTALLIALTLLVPLFLYLRLFFGVFSLAMDYSAERQRVAPRVARLEGLLAREALLVELRDEAKNALEDLVYSVADDTPTLAAALQADVRQVLTDAGLVITNSQVLPSRTDESFDRIAVKLTVSGSLPALDAALIGVAAMRPRLLVETLDVFPQRVTRGANERGQTLGAVIQLFALRVSE
jgi:general secretion pathway protein M